MLYLKILSIAIPYLVLSYFAWIDYKGNDFLYQTWFIAWSIITVVGYFIYLLWLFGAFK